VSEQDASKPQHVARRAVVLSGAGRFADQWHDFAATSSRIADILSEAGFETEIAENVDERMADLSDAQLVVVNIGGPAVPDLSADAHGHVGLLAYVTRGGPLLAMHSATSSLPSIPEWEAIVGGAWIPGTTMHPDYGRSHVLVHARNHPIVSTLGDFDLYDERYSYLRTGAGLTYLAEHELDGIGHPILWAHTYGTARIVYDALGHDAASYDSAVHREIITRAALWLVDDLDRVGDLDRVDDSGEREPVAQLDETSA
jgi:type 1 glutamine amidotransferase